MQKYGQHFLVSELVIAQIIDAVLLLRADNLVEIGPGKGALTSRLVARGVTDFTAVEIDPEMIAYLEKTLPQTAGIKVVQQDFLAFDLSQLSAVPTEFVSNLPYIDAAAILDKVLAWPYFKSAVFMFQKEQAQKITARVGDEFYGALSVLTQLRAEVSLVCNAGRGCFNPPPKVESRVLAFQKIKRPLFERAAWDKIARLVKNAFLHRRKTLFNALALAGYEKDKIALALKACNLNEKVRPEQVSPAQYAQIAQRL